MARPKGTTKTPTYRHYKRTDKGVVTIMGRTYTLDGAYGSAESRRHYDRLIAEWLSAGRALPTKAMIGEMTIDELVGLYWKWFLDQPRQSSERRSPSGVAQVRQLRISLKHLRRLYGSTKVVEFGPLALRALLIEFTRQRSPRKPHLHWTRETCNNHLIRICGMFRWAVANELAPERLIPAVAAVRLLKAGEGGRESAPVEAADDRDVEAVINVACPQVAAMLSIQRLTGMRIGEILSMKTVEIDTAGEVWAYRPTKHKTTNKGGVRLIAIGPKAKEYLRPYLSHDLHALIFTPRRTFEETRSTRYRSRQARRRENKPRKVAERYDSNGFSKTIRLLCKKIVRAEAKLPTPPARPFKPWHTHQLRHAAAEFIRDNYGLEIARAQLGHARERMTERYAKQDFKGASAAMTAIG